MVHFLIEILRIRDRATYEQYLRQAEPILRSFGGAYVFRSELFEVVSGDWDVQRFVCISFPNTDRLKQCFASEAYARISHLRKESVESRAVIIDPGLRPD